MMYPLVGDLASSVASIKYGAPEQEDSEIGPLITAKHRERVAALQKRQVMPALQPLVHPAGHRQHLVGRRQVV